MTIVKVIELIGQGKSIDAAVKSAVEEASQTLKEIKQVNVKHISALVENGQVTTFRVTVKLSFVVDHKLKT